MICLSQTNRQNVSKAAVGCNFWPLTVIGSTCGEATCIFGNLDIFFFGEYEDSSMKIPDRFPADLRDRECVEMLGARHSTTPISSLSESSITDSESRRKAEDLAYGASEREERVVRTGGMLGLFADFSLEKKM